MFQSLLTLLCVASLTQEAAGQARLMLTPVSRYRTSPEIIVDRQATPQLGFVGQVETLEARGNKYGERGIMTGTAVLISPCYALTNHHVVFGSDLWPEDGNNYSVKLRLGTKPNGEDGFLGYTIATPVFFKHRRVAGVDDWVILRMKTCMGARFGWIEFSERSAHDLSGLSIAVAGFAGDRNDGQLSVALGRAYKEVLGGPLIYHSASAAAGQSSGPVMIREDGVLKLAGIHTIERGGSDGHSNTFDAFDEQNANSFYPVISFMRERLFDTSSQRFFTIEEVLNADKSSYAANPLISAMKDPLPSSPAF